MSKEPDFVQFVSARWTSLYRLAHLLTASPTAAEDLLQTTLEKADVNWSRIGRMEFPEAYVRRMLVNALMSSRRRTWLREVPTDSMSEVSVGRSMSGCSTGRCCGRWCEHCPRGSGP